MKNLKLTLLALFTILALQSCKDDEEAQKADVVGEWNVTELNIDMTVNGESLSSFFATDAEAELYEALFAAAFEDIFADVTITFNSDNTYTSQAPGSSAENGTWSISGDKLILDEGTADEFAFDIISSSSSLMKLQYAESDSSTDVDQDGTNDEFKITLDLTLTK